MSFFHSFGTPVTILRPFNTYGPRQSARAVIPTIISQIASGSRRIKLGATQPTRDFNYIDDTVSAFSAAVDSDLAPGEVLNVGSNYEISIGDLTTLVAEVMGHEVEIECDMARLRPAGIFGNIGESRESLEKGVRFLLDYGDNAELRTIRPVTAYPGTPLYEHAIAKGLLKDCEGFYENKHTNSDLLSINFTELSDEDFHEALLDANRRLIERYYDHLKATAIDTATTLYRQRDASFRGFRQS